MWKKDVARIALVGVLAKRGVALSPRAKIFAPVGTLKVLLPSMVQALLNLKETDLLETHLLFDGREVKVTIKGGNGNFGSKKTPRKVNEDEN